MKNKNKQTFIVAKEIGMPMDMILVLGLAAISILPYIELRGAIPVAIAKGLGPIEAFLVCTIANILIIPVIFLFMDHIYPYFAHLGFVQKTLVKVHAKTHSQVKKYGALGLCLFVAVPLPGTGAYSGTLASYVFEINKKNAFSSIALGVTIAGVLVTLISAGAYKLIA